MKVRAVSASLQMPMLGRCTILALSCQRRDEQLEIEEVTTEADFEPFEPRGATANACLGPYIPVILASIVAPRHLGGEQVRACADAFPE